MPLSLLNHSALALFAQRTRIPTSARSIGFCAIWVCISSTKKKTEKKFNAKTGFSIPYGHLKGSIGSPNHVSNQIFTPVGAQGGHFRYFKKSLNSHYWNFSINTPCSQRLRRRGRLRKLCEPRARPSVRPGGLLRRRLNSNSN